MSENKLTVIPRAPDIDPIFEFKIAELYRIGRTENYKGMVMIVLLQDGAITLPHIENVERQFAIGAIYDAIDDVRELYDLNSEEIDKDSGE